MSIKQVGRLIAATTLAASMLGGATGAIAQMGSGMMGGDRGAMMGPSGESRTGQMMWGMDHGMGMMGMTDPAMVRDLTAEQREGMRTLRREMRRAHMEAMLEMMDVHDEMKEAMTADRPDPQKIRKLHDRMAALHGNVLQSRIETRNRMHDVLTKAQQERLRAMRRMGPEN